MKNFAVSALTAVIYFMEQTIGRLLSTNTFEIPSEYHASCSVNQEGAIEDTEIPSELIARVEFTQLYSDEAGESMLAFGQFAFLDHDST